MKYLALSLLAAILVSGCAMRGISTAPDAVGVSDATKAAQMSAAKEAAHRCTGNGVRALDDFVSPADVIGRRIADACYTEWMVYNKYVRPLRRRTAYMVGWYHRQSNKHRAFATQSVIRFRSVQAAVSSHTSDPKKANE